MKILAPKIYAGIGSRKTPIDICTFMTAFASVVSTKGWLLRSGNAIRADKAFQDGAGIKQEVYTPMTLSDLRFTKPKVWRSAFRLAEHYCPHWENCDAYARMLHARNSMILFGEDMDDCVDAIVCWTEGGKIIGGTGQALRIAKGEKIPVYNLAVKQDIPKLQKRFGLIAPPTDKDLRKTIEKFWRL